MKILRDCIGAIFVVFILCAMFYPFQAIEEEQIEELSRYPFNDDPVNIITTNNGNYTLYYKVEEPEPIKFRDLRVGDTIKVKRYRNLYGYGIGLSAEPILPEQNLPSWWKK